MRDRFLRGPLIFETHATSFDNEAGLASGWYDVDLSPRGESQARDMGERYAGRDLDVVYCSDLRRSYRSAEIAFDGRGISVVRDARLREIDYGALTRRPSSEIESIRTAHVRTPFSAGESYEQVTRRVGACLEEIARNHSGTVLLVAHRATFYALEHLLRGVSLAEAVAAPWQWQPGWSYRITPNS